MKLSMTGQKKVTFKYRWLFTRGDHIGRFYCIQVLNSIWETVYGKKFLKFTEAV